MCAGLMRKTSHSAGEVTVGEGGEVLVIGVSARARVGVTIVIITADFAGGREESKIIYLV